MTVTTRALLSIAAIMLLALGAHACGGSSEQAGQACEAPADCYPDIDPADIRGAIECLDRVEGGYCTHLCETDADCCAVPGECRSDLPQVCAPFESTGQKRCFLSCEAAVVGDRDETAFCQEFASDAFLCRSTGGGAENRKVCVP